MLQRRMIDNSHVAHSVQATVVAGRTRSPDLLEPRPRRPGREAKQTSTRMFAGLATVVLPHKLRILHEVRVEYFIPASPLAKGSDNCLLASIDAYGSCIWLCDKEFAQAATPRHPRLHAWSILGPHPTLAILGPPSLRP